MHLVILWCLSFFKSLIDMAGTKKSWIELEKYNCPDPKFNKVADKNKI